MLRDLAGGPLTKSVVSPRMIARQDEQAYLEALLARCRPDNAPGGTGPELAERRVQTLIVSGEAGIGKSRLTAAAETMARSQGYCILRGHCYETDQALPYAPLRDLFHRYLAGRAVPLPPAALPALDPLLPQRTPGDTHDLPPDLQKQRLFEAFGGFCLDLAKRNPLLLIVEDLHWCDDSTIELLVHLVRRSEHAPVLLLLTLRPDEAPPAVRYAIAELERLRAGAELRLRPLARGDVDALLRAVFAQDRPIRTDFLDAIFTLSEGNPFYVEEVLKSLLMAGDIYFEDGAWDRKPLGEIHIPSSIQEVVRRRRAQLSGPAQSLLEAAAVAGRRFDFDLLQAVLLRDEYDLLAQLKELLAAQMIIEEAPDHFAFRHALAREAVYKVLLGRERTALHRRIGTILAARRREPGSGEPPTPAELAYHYTEGQLWPETLEYAGRAGDDALALYAPRAAIEQYTRALAAAGRLQAPATEIYLKRGKAYALRNEFELALADFTQALETARRRQGAHSPAAETGIESNTESNTESNAQAAREEWEALLALGRLWGTRDYARVGEYLHQALAAARELGDQALVGRTLNQLGNWQMNIEQPFAARRYHEEALETFRRLADRAGTAETLDMLAIVQYNCGDLLGGRCSYEEAVPLWRELDDRRGLLHSLSGLALRADFNHEYDPLPVAECIPHGEESMRIAQAIHWQSAESMALICVGLVYTQAGDWQTALDRYVQAIAIAREIEHPGWLADSLHAIGALLADLGEPEAARAALEEGLAVARSHNSLIWVRQNGAALAVLHAAAGRLAEASAVLAATTPAPAASVAGPRAGATLQERLLATAAVEVHLAAGDGAAALTGIEAIIQATTNLTADRVVPRLWRLRGLALAALGRYAEAESDLQVGLAAAVAQGRQPLAAQIAAALGQVYVAAGKLEQAQTAADTCHAILAPLLARLPDTPLAYHGASSRTLRESATLATTAWLPPGFHFAGAEEAGAPRAPISPLSPRELEVAALVAEGLTNRAIAETLVISERTAERHIANIMAKLGMNSRAHIAAYVAAGLSR